MKKLTMEFTINSSYCTVMVSFIQCYLFGFLYPCVPPHWYHLSAALKTTKDIKILRLKLHDCEHDSSYGIEGKQNINDQ